MALLKPNRVAQYPLIREFIFNWNDTMADINGVTKDFGSVTIASAPVVDIIGLPPGAVVCGGELIVEIAGVGPTAYTVKLGIAGDDACYLAASDLLAAANTRYPLLLTKALNSNAAGANMRMTMVDSVAVASAGKFRVRVMYTIEGRSNEVQIT